MSFSPAGGNISGADDVALSNPTTNQLLTFDATTAKWVNGGGTITTTTRGADYTLQLSDAGTAIDVNSATSRIITIPLNSTVAFAVGTIIEIAQIGAGQVTVATASGVTLQTASATMKTRARYATLGLRKRATDTWLLSGDTE
ncbi:MAG TPA: hypothetical protein VF597_03165 [Candidatus Saccharimonadales bacterium]